jgi:small subunit ribosomal protein S8e
MAIERTRSTRKATSGRLHPYRKSRQFARVRPPLLTKIGERKTYDTRAIGGHTKVQLIAINTISVADPKTKKVVKTTITDVLENKANRNYVIRDIVNKGAIVQTELGKVRVTSRPGQVGCLSGVLVQ